MDGKEVQKYMSPITFEAEMFVESLENLSKTYNNIDANVISSLEKVIKAIETFMDTSKNVILPTETTKLVACNIKNIKRIYHCSNCKTDLGKSTEKATLHLIESCSPHASLRQTSESNSTAYRNNANELKDKKSRRKEEKMLRRNKKNDRRICQAVQLTKRTRKLLTTNYEQFFADHEKISEKLKCLPAYDIIENDLMSIITPLFPKQSVRIYKFGSRLAGIGTRESDLDFFIDIGGTFNNFQNRADPETVAKLNKVGQALGKSRKTWKGLVKIEKARVPILRVIHADTSIECDINFSNSLGIFNTQYLEFNFSLQPIARLLCIFLKKWLSRTSLNDDFSTYSIILMVLFYLQNLNILPSLEKLQQGVNTENALTVGPWLCCYKTLNLNELNIPHEEVTHGSILKYIEGFFQFYKSFNYDENVICPYLGKSIKRTELYRLMPERYTNYVKDYADYALEMDSPIVVQDPIQLNHNVTKAVSLLNRQVFTTLILNSLKVLHDNFLF